MQCIIYVNPWTSSRKLSYLFCFQHRIETKIQDNPFSINCFFWLFIQGLFQLNMIHCTALGKNALFMPNANVGMLVFQPFYEMILKTSKLKVFILKPMKICIMTTFKSQVLHIIKIKYWNDSGSGPLLSLHRHFTS